MSEASVLGLVSVQQRLNLDRTCAIVYIARNPPDLPVQENALGCACIHVPSLQDVMSGATRTQLAQAVSAVQSDDQSPDGARSAAEAVSVIAVLEIAAEDQSVESMLGQAIRLFPDHLLVNCSDYALRDEFFFAFGFRRFVLPAHEQADQTVGKSADQAGLRSTGSRWYEYRMCNYKAAPDWLNARFWANPERFDQLDDPDLYCEEE